MNNNEIVIDFDIVNKVHNRLLDMAKIITNIFEENDIPYSISYGTLLGAIRHKGFIPWDLDFDLWLFDDSYNKAIDCLKKELPDDLFLEDETTEPNYFHSWAHVKDTKTVLHHKRFKHDDNYSHHGIYIDLYRLKLVKKCNLQSYLNNENRKYIQRRRILNFMDDDEYNIRIEKLLEDEKKVYNNSEKSDENVFALINAYKCKYLNINYVYPLIKYKFEDTSFFGINKAEQFLGELYGDYMTPPPYEQRWGEMDSVEFL